MGCKNGKLHQKPGFGLRRWGEFGRIFPKNDMVCMVLDGWSSTAAPQRLQFLRLQVRQVEKEEPLHMKSAWDVD